MKNISESNDSQLTFSPIKKRKQSAAIDPLLNQGSKYSDNLSLRMEAAQLTPPRTGVNPTPADETPGLQSRDSRNPSLDHTLDYSKHEARLTRDPQPASSYHGTYREEDVNSALREEQKREWLSKKRTEYSATLLSPERDHPKDMSHAYQTCDVLTDGSLTMSWKSRQVLHQNLLMIKKVYTAYATYGVVEFTNSMNSGNFHRLIQDCLRNTEENSRLQGSLSRRSVKGFARYVDHHKDSRIESRDQVTIGPRDVELLFLEYSYEETQEQRRRLLSQTQSVFPVGIETLTERISESKILFEDFLNILLRLSAMIEPAEQEHVALNHFLKRNMEPLLDSDIVKVGFNDLSCVSRLKTILQNPTQLKMLGALYKNIQVYFTFYSSCRGKMDYKGFQSFFKDFGLYPSRVSANTLRNYFSALVSLDVVRWLPVGARNTLLS